MGLLTFFRKFLPFMFGIFRNFGLFDQTDERARVSAVGMFIFFLLGKPAVDFVFDGSISLSSFFFTLLFSPLLAGCFLLFERDSHWVRTLGLFYAVIIFSGTCLLFSILNPQEYGFQIFLEFKLLKAFNWSCVVGIDNFSFLFIILTSFLFCVTFLSCWSNTKSNLYFTELLFITEFILFLVFSSLDLVFFLIAYEAVIIPVFLIIGIWGGRSQRVYAAYLFFYYTFAGSIAMLFSIIYIYLTVGSTSLFIVSNFTFTLTEQFFLFVSFFIAFASKLPLYPLHSWLPEAHVEAPTAGSVLLAGILLKMGGYGIVRWCFSLFSEISLLSSDLINTISILSILYASFSALQQLDIKRIIAYSSIAHMGFVVMGLFTFTESGLLGAIFLMVSHGFISAGLFLCIGVLYDRYGTRSVMYYGGLAQLMPIYDTVFFFLCLANIAFPGTAGFPGEFLVLYSVYSTSPTMFFVLLIGVLMTGVYTIWMYCRIMLGPIDPFGYLEKFSDINMREISIFVSLFFPIMIFGLFPNFIFYFSNFWVIFSLSGITTSFMLS